MLQRGQEDRRCQDLCDRIQREQDPKEKDRLTEALAGRGASSLLAPRVKSWTNLFFAGAYNRREQAEDAYLTALAKIAHAVKEVERINNILGFSQKITKRVCIDELKRADPWWARIYLLMKDLHKNPPSVYLISGDYVSLSNRKDWDPRALYQQSKKLHLLTANPMAAVRTIEDSIPDEIQSYQQFHQFIIALLEWYGGKLSRQLIEAVIKQVYGGKSTSLSLNSDPSLEEPVAPGDFTKDLASADLWRDRYQQYIDKSKSHAQMTARIRQIALLEMYYCDEMSFEEVGKHVGIDRSNVGRIICEARQGLLTMIEKEMDHVTR